MKKKKRNLPNTITKMVKSEKGLNNFIYLRMKKIFLTMFIILLVAIVAILTLWFGGVI